MAESTTKFSLEAVNSPLKLLGLALLVVEAALAALIFYLPPEHRLIAFGIFAGIVSLTLLVLVALEKLSQTALLVSGQRIVCRRLLSRSEMYLECARLIRSANEIRDVTWGREPRGLSTIEKKAREKYRKAVEEALVLGKSYFELFSYSNSWKDALLSAIELNKKHSNFQCRIVEGDLTGLSMLDFMIADHDKIVFSHIDAQNYTPRFLFVQSEELVALFLQFYQESWAAAKSASHETIDSIHRKLSPEAGAN